MSELLALSGKVALVTGASRGIGAAIALHLAQAGATVLINYSRSEEAARGVATQVEHRGGKATLLKGDVSQAKDVDALFEEIKGPIDILVNNAGIYQPGPLAEFSEEDFDKTFLVNVKSLFLVTKKALGRLPDGGRVINIGSVIGERVPFAGASVYAASKFAVAGFTRAWSRELAPRKITVNAVQPGPIDTDMNPADTEKNPAADFMRNSVPLGRYGTADEVAALVAFLATPAAAFITGATINVDGGWSREKVICERARFMGSIKSGTGEMDMDRRELLRSGLGAAGALILSGRVRGEDAPEDTDLVALIAKIGPIMNSIAITVEEVAEGLSMIKGPCGNMAVLRGPEGLTVIDSGVPARGRELFETAKKVGGRPVSMLINTHWHFDHAGGNEAFGKGGATIMATAATRKRLANEQYTEVFKLTTPASPEAALPTLTFVHEAEHHVGGETIELIAVPPAHTDGDLIARFKKNDVIHTGDLFSNGFYPNIDGSSGGWIGGMIGAADLILKMAGPKTKIIPGHGPIAGAAELAAFRQMLATIHDRLTPMINAGKSVEEAISARPTKDLDAVWAKGFFNGGMFTRVVYDGLKKHKALGG